MRRNGYTRLPTDDTRGRPASANSRPANANAVERMTGGPTVGPYEGVMRNHNRGTEANMHERLKEEIYKQGQQKDFSYQLQTAGSGGGGQIIRDVGFVSNYIHFTSADKNASSRTDDGELTFSIPLINNNNAIQNIVKFRIHSMYFPRIEGPITQPDTYFFRRLFVLVKPLPTNSVLGSNSSQHHFEFDVENITSIAVDCKPLGKEGERGEFVFNKPVTQLSDITFQFLRPAFGTRSLASLPLPQDTLAVRTIPNTNPARFEVLGGDTTAPIGPIGVAAAPGIAVYFAGLNTSNNTINELVNNANGQYVTTIVSNTIFEVANLNFTVPPVNVTAFPLVVYIAKNRIAFTVEFITIRANEATQFIDVYHK